MYRRLEKAHGTTSDWMSTERLTHDSSAVAGFALKRLIVRKTYVSFLLSYCRANRNLPKESSAFLKSCNGPLVDDKYCHMNIGTILRESLFGESATQYNSTPVRSKKHHIYGRPSMIYSTGVLIMLCINGRLPRRFRNISLPSHLGSRKDGGQRSTVTVLLTN